MDEQYKQDFLKAGEIAGKVRAYGASLIVPGASYNEVIKKIQTKIQELGGFAAFPPQIALNEVAAHYLPEPNEDVIFKDQLVSLDVGVSVNGAIGDCAISIDLSGKHQKLVDASRAALEAAQKILKVGLPICEIGRVISDTVASYGFIAVRNLSGHGLGKYNIHTKPSIPNYNNENTATLQPGMTFAIEPFASNGAGVIYDAGNPLIFSFSQKRPVRSPIAKQVLKKIQKWNGLPFAMHDLISPELPLYKVKFGITELVKLGVLIGHAPLIDEAKGMVTQAENTVLIDEKGNIHITTE